MKFQGCSFLDSAQMLDSVSEAPSPSKIIHRGDTEDTGLSAGKTKLAGKTASATASLG